MAEHRGECGGPRRDGRRKGCRAITCLSQKLQDKGGFKTCGVNWELAAEAKAIKEKHRKKREEGWAPVGETKRTIHYNEEENR